MVQNQVTISAPMRRWFRGLSAKPGHWRKAQEARKSKRISQYHTPSASQDSWRRGSNFPRDMKIFHFCGRALAEGVSWLDCYRLVVILNHAEIQNNPCLFKRPRSRDLG